MEKCFIIAEAGNCHEGSFEVALQMISEAQWAGADAVKFQAGTAESFARNAVEIAFYKNYELDYGEYAGLIDYGKQIGIPVFFSIWHDKFEPLRRVELFHKIPARQFCPSNVRKYDYCNTFVSIPHTYNTEVCEEIEIKRAVPLHCVTHYPTTEPMLETIPKIRKAFNCNVGYSDHTIGIKACLDAVGKYGVTVIEKHFTLDNDFGILRDHKLSATPLDFKVMVDRIKGGRC